MQSHGITQMLILTEIRWVFLADGERDGRTATVSDASTEKEELASASQASSYLQSPEVQEQESASSSFTDKAESTCFLFQD